MDELVLIHPAGEHGATDAWTAWIMCGAAAVYLLGNALFRRATGGRWSAWHLGGVVVALALALLRDAVTPLTLSWLTNAVLLVVLVGDVARARRAVASA